MSFFHSPQKWLASCASLFVLSLLIFSDNAAASTQVGAATDPALLQPTLQAVRVSVPPTFADSYKGPGSFNLPAGFTVSVFANLSSPRLMAVGACGDLFVGTSGGTVYRLPDRNHDGVADSVNAFASGNGMAAPVHSVEYYNARYYIGASNGVWRFEQPNCDSPGNNATKLMSLPSGVGHATRTVLHGEDGSLFVSVGSSCNVCVESDWRRAAVLISGLNGENPRIFSSGTRNDVGLAVRPGTSELWSTENGRDNMNIPASNTVSHNYTPPEEINLLQAGGYYGWPYCYGDGQVDTSGTAPTFAAGSTALVRYCAASTRPLVKIQAHTAPLGLTFSQDSSLAFPTDLKKGLFVALHGSWNRDSGNAPVGYKVIYLPTFAAHPSGAWNTPTIDLMTISSGTGFRPVGVTVGPDNALYVSADAQGVIYRVSYNGQ